MDLNIKQLRTTVEMVRKYLVRYLSSYLQLFDFTKAFDTVSHECLEISPTRYPCKNKENDFGTYHLAVVKRSFLYTKVLCRLLNSSRESDD